MKLLHWLVLPILLRIAFRRAVVTDVPFAADYDADYW